MKEVGFCIPYKNIIFITEKPTQIHWKDGRLHNENGKSVEYKDGWGIYTLNGCAVTEEIVTTPAEKLDPKLLLTTDNAEVRREILRKVDFKNILKKLEGKKLDSYREYTLYEFDNIDIETVHFLHMVCPSTSGEYVIRTNPKFTTARESAIDMNCGIKPEEFLVEA